MVDVSLNGRNDSRSLQLEQGDLCLKQGGKVRAAHAEVRLGRLQRGRRPGDELLRVGALLGPGAVPASHDPRHVSGDAISGGHEGLAQSGGVLQKAAPSPFPSTSASHGDGRTHADTHQVRALIRRGLDRAQAIAQPHVQIWPRVHTRERSRLFRGLALGIDLVEQRPRLLCEGEPIALRWNRKRRHLGRCLVALPGLAPQGLIQSGGQLDLSAIEVAEIIAQLIPKNLEAKEGVLADGPGGVARLGGTL